MTYLYFFYYCEARAPPILPKAPIVDPIMLVPACWAATCCCCAPDKRVLDRINERMQKYSGETQQVQDEEYITALSDEIYSELTALEQRDWEFKMKKYDI